MRPVSALCLVAAASMPAWIASCSDDDGGAKGDRASGGSPGNGGRATGGGAASSGGASGASTGGTTSPSDAGPDVSVPGADASADAAPRHDAAPRCVTSDGAAGGAYRWQLHYPDAFADHVASDSSGAAIVNGSFTGTLNIGAFTLSSNGSADFHLERVLPSGAVDWAKSYGGTSADYALNLVVDPEDWIFFSGVYDGRGNAGGRDFAPFTGTANRFWGFLAGYDPGGRHAWSRELAATSESDVSSLAVDDEGTLFAGGRHWGDLSLGDAGVTAGAGGSDVYFLRLDAANGTIMDQLALGGATDERGGIVAWTGSNVLVAFDFGGTIGVPGAGEFTSAGGSDVLVIEVDRSGAILNAARHGGAGDEFVIDGVWTGTHFVLTGQTNSVQVAFRPGETLSTAGAADVFVIAVEPSLGIAWAKVFGGTADDRPREITAGPCGELALAGEFRESMMVGGHRLTALPPAAGGPTAIDAFVVKTNADFEPLWARAFGSPQPDRGLGVAFDRDGGVYLTVAFQGSVDFGGGALAPGGAWGSALVSLAP